MHDLVLVGFLVALFAMGVARPFLMVCAYVYIDVVSPQQLTYWLLNTLSISMIAGAGALGLWLLFDNKADARVAPRQVLIVLLLGICGYTTAHADFPVEAKEAWDYLWKAMMFAAFLPLTLRTRLRIETLPPFSTVNSSSVSIRRRCCCSRC